MDYEEILKKKKEELLKKQLEKQKEEEQKLLLMKEIEKNLSLIMDKEALSRYYNIKTINPELALAVAQYIIQLYHQGLIKEKIDDKRFKLFLEKIMPKKKEPKIKFIRK
jgi:DNA-binding TFAR19-related protein (PDSD5 family)